MSGLQSRPGSANGRRPEATAPQSRRGSPLGRNSRLGPPTTATPPGSSRPVRSARRYGQWLGAVAVVVAAVVAGGWLYANKGGVSEVLVIDRPVAAGHVVTEDDLGSASVSGVEGAVDVSDLEQVVGQRAAVSLVAGQVLTRAALTSQPLPGGTQRVVAVAIPAGRVPATLAAGAVVDVVAVPQSGDAATGAVLDSPQLVASGASVYGLAPADDGSVVVTLLLSASDAPQVAAYGSAGRLTVIQAPLEAGE